MARSGADDREAREGPTEAVPSDRGVDEYGIASDAEPSFFEDPRRLVQTVGIVLVLVVAIYFLFPKLVGVDDAMERLGTGDPLWIAIAIALSGAMFFSYVGLFKGVIGEELVQLNWRESYQVTMAGLAATRLFSAGGAGGIVLTYWALRKAGMERRQSAARMVAFLVLLYAVYMLALVVCGVLLRTGVLSGDNPVGLTVVPAALAGAVIAIFLLIALIPGDLERRLAEARPDTKLGRLAVKLATGPATMATGTRIAIDFVRRPSRGGLAILGAVGFWATNIAILWASFQAFDVAVPGAVVVQGFFIGMVANLFPFAPGGVGAVDAGMIGAFVLFGIDGGAVFAAVLMYRLIAFWLPLPPGVLAFFGLRKTVARWEEERGTTAAMRRASGRQARNGAASPLTSESKV